MLKFWREFDQSHTLCIIYLGACTCFTQLHIYYSIFHTLTNLRSDVELSNMFQTKPIQTFFPYSLTYQKIPRQNQLVLSAANSFKVMT